MLRNIIRTSRGLVRRNKLINSLTPATTTFTRLNPCVCNTVINRTFSTPSDNPQSSDHIEPAVFEEICTETLESLCEYFEELVDDDPNLKGADVTYSDGVLTVSFGPKHGTYVINRQTPNKQIWLSSPTSGPKRYDLVLKDGGYWVYKHDGVTLHKLLQDEISKIVQKAEFHKCAHSVL
ncbi:frataxin-like domain-containing protein [Phthorimaea operculella]|nr:frataxin-like domain-containing protein [Phthorimaea operculella]